MDPATLASYRRQTCAPHRCALASGLHIWDGSRWWELLWGDRGAIDEYQGLHLPCMRGRGPGAPRPALPPEIPRTARPDVIERARRYVARMPGAISGSCGSAATMAVAVALVRGFALAPGDALVIMVEDYNPRCAPPWTLRELRHKVRSAMQRGKMPMGKMLEARR